MLSSVFNSVLTQTSGGISFGSGEFLACTGVSLLLGIVIASVSMFRSNDSKSYVITLALLPAMVQMVILLVNGNLGTGVAVMGAFSLVRFRSVAGSARQISSIFLAMAAGLATGMGYLGTAIVFVVLVEAVWILLMMSPFGEKREPEYVLRITIPESLNETGTFDDIFEKYLKKQELVQVKTSNMGSLYKLEYHIVFRRPGEEKRMIDDLRCRNGNLEILCSVAASGGETL